VPETELRAIVTPKPTIIAPALPLIGAEVGCWGTAMTGAEGSYVGAHVLDRRETL
jgi:hypothetical protein